MSPVQAPQTILVIDDEVDHLKMLKKQLEHWGYGVLTAQDGQSGLELAESEQPDLILLDVLMPRMKGREVCAHLKTNPKTQKIPVIFVTALGMAEHVKAGLESGADDYVIKPFQPADLRERIQVCFARHPRKPTPRE